MVTVKSASLLVGLVTSGLAAPVAEGEVAAPSATGVHDASFLKDDVQASILKERDNTCMDYLGPDSFADVNDAVACINYLASLGDTPCTASVSGTLMCNIEGTQITGLSVGGPTFATSSCNDVARGAGRIMDLCARGDGTVRGQWDAWGNGNLRVDIRRVH